MQIGNKTLKVNTMGQKFNLQSLLGKKNISNLSNGLNNAQNNLKNGIDSMHNTLANNIGNSSHSVYVPTGINLKLQKNKKSNLEK